MGWSCTQKASQTEHLWSEFCRKYKQSSNVFPLDANRDAFYEINRIEYDDGRITGEIFELVGENHASKISDFRINGDGTIQQAPLALRRAAGEAI